MSGDVWDLMNTEGLNDLRLQALSAQFPIEGVAFRNQDALLLIEIETPFAKALMTPHGATVLSYCPKDQQGNLQHDLLWVSEQAVFDGKAAIRGGIPVCWPWFSGYQAEYNSPLAEDATPSAHGFVRKAAWHLQNIEILPNSAISVVFSLSSSEETLAIWPYEFSLELRVVIGQALELTLTTKNLSSQEIKLTEALHTYFNLPSNASVMIDGLKGAIQIDTLNQNQQQNITSEIVVQAPMDNVYLNSQSSLIAKQNGQAVLQIDSSNADSCILWNPGPETVKGFKDITDDHWPQFVCIENGNVWSNAVTLPAKGTHQLEIAIRKP